MLETIRQNCCLISNWVWDLILVTFDTCSLWELYVAVLALNWNKFPSIWIYGTSNIEEMLKKG
jgi:hypothetical protein